MSEPWLEQSSSAEPSPALALDERGHDAELDTDLPAGSLPAPAPDIPDLARLGRALLREAEGQTSALGRARALLVATALEEHLGQTAAAAEHARDAAEIAPKLSLAAAEARRLRADDDENAVRRLEATVRLAEPGPTRLHAGLQLAHRLRLAGEPDRAARVLDHIARAEGAAPTQALDARLELERLVHRLAAAEPILGLKVSEDLVLAAQSVQELLGSPASALPSAAGGEASAARAPYLPLLRAAREMRAGRMAEATELLLGSLPASEDVLLLCAAYAATRRDGAAASKKLLLQALELSPTRTTWRALALMALSSGDKNLLSRVLTECDPGSGTFETDERLLLLSLAGQAPSMAEDEWQLLRDRYGILARALSPLGDVQEVPGSKEIKYLQLGKPTEAVGDLLEDLAHGRFEPSGSEQRSSEETAQSERALATLWRLLEARGRGDRAREADALTELSEWEGEAPRLFAALLRESLGDREAAARDYAELRARAPKGASPEGHSALIARALEELEGGQGTTAEHSGLPTADLVQALLSHGTSEVGRSALAGSKARGTPLSLALLEAMAGRGAGLSVPPPAPAATESSPHSALPLEVALATRSALRRALVDHEGSAASFGTLATAEPGDLALGVLARTFDPRFRASVASHAGARFLEAVDVARACLDRPAAEARNTLRSYLEGQATGVEQALLLHLAELAEDHDSVARDHLDVARTAEDPLDRRYAYGQLAEIDASRGQPGSALLFWQTVSEEWPRDIAALLAQEEALERSGNADDLAGIQARLADTLPSPEADAYRTVLATAALGRMDLRAAQRHLEPLLEGESPHLLALRVLEAASPEPDDDAALQKAQTGLLPLLTSDLDQVACLHETALAAVRLGRRSLATRCLEQARELRPEDFLTELFAYHLLEDDDPIPRAEALERLAQASNVPAHATDLWRAAGLTWQRGQDGARATECLQRCLELDPADEEAFLALRRLYKEARAQSALVDLLEGRLRLDLPSKQARELELELGHLLIELGQSPKAKILLEGTLARHPRDVVVLRLHAEIAGELGDHRASEQSLASLTQSLPSGPERTAVYRALGRLYDKHFGALEKAMDAYQAALESDGSDLDLIRTLVSVYARLGLGERATVLQTELIQKAPLPDDKRREALELSRLYEQVAEDPARAGATLERTRRAWPLDQAVLTASAEFYERQGDSGRARALVEQTSAEARHKLQGGKLDAGLLATLAAVADLSGKPQSRDAIAAARSAYLGEGGAFAAAGPRALDAALDDLLAPPVLIAPLRNLLQKTSAALDAAFPIDLAPLDAHELTDGPIVSRLTEICQELGQPRPGVFVSSALGSRAVPLTTRPLRLIVGAELEELPADSIEYLLARALKLQQLGAGALARSRPEDAWPMIVALMTIFAPNYRPQGVDQRKILQARALVEQGLARTGYDADVPTLVLETIGALRRQTEGLAEAPRLLVNRAAMLLAGGPGAALLAMSFGDKKPLPESGPSRYRWIDAHAEAKDLLLFCASDECASALGRLSSVRGRAPPRLGQ